MSESAAVDHPVRVHFRKKDKESGKSVSYDPLGEDGWPGAKSVISLVPGSHEAKELFDGAGSHHGPLIDPPRAETAESKTPAARTPAKSADSKES